MSKFLSYQFGSEKWVMVSAEFCFSCTLQDMMWDPLLQGQGQLPKTHISFGLKKLARQILLKMFYVKD